MLVIDTVYNALELILVISIGSLLYFSSKALLTLLVPENDDNMTLEEFEAFIDREAPQPIEKPANCEYCGRILDRGKCPGCGGNGRI